MASRGNKGEKGEVERDELSERGAVGSCEGQTGVAEEEDEDREHGCF